MGHTERKPTKISWATHLCFTSDVHSSMAIKRSFCSSAVCPHADIQRTSFISPRPIPILHHLSWLYNNSLVQLNAFSTDGHPYTTLHYNNAMWASGVSNTRWAEVTILGNASLDNFALTETRYSVLFLWRQNLSAAVVFCSAVLYVRF